MPTYHGTHAANIAAGFYDVMRGLDGDDIALLRKSMLTVCGGEVGLRLLRRTGGAAHLLNSFDQIDQAGAEIRILRESAAGRTKGWRAVEPERRSVGERLIGGLAVSLDRAQGLRRPDVRLPRSQPPGLLERRKSGEPIKE